MLHLIPRHCAPWPVTLGALGNPSPAAIARALGVSERTAYRWQASESAPRAAQLALHWVTPWGQDHIGVEIGHRVAILQQLAAAQAREIAALRAANGPSLHPRPHPAANDAPGAREA